MVVYLFIALRAAIVALQMYSEKIVGAGKYQEYLTPNVKRGNEMKYSDYMLLSNSEKLNLFMNTLFETNRIPTYWTNWDNVFRNIKEHEINLNTLNYLVHKDDIEYEAKKLFLSQPNLLKTIPILIAAREEIFNLLSFDNGHLNYSILNFKNPDVSKIDEYVSFMKESGLLDFLKNGLNVSLVDYVYGVQVGLDSNGRKNRSGKQNEKILEYNLNELKMHNKDLDIGTQLTAESIKKLWNVSVPDAKDDEARGGRRYDGVVYNKETKKVTLIETNFYVSDGSKLKAVAGEFSNLYTFLKQNAPENVNFVWISDGPGWRKEKNPMKEAFNIIPNIINLSMIENKYLDEIVKK